MDVMLVSLLRTTKLSFSRTCRELCCISLFVSYLLKNCMHNLGGCEKMNGTCLIGTRGMYICKIRARPRDAIPTNLARGPDAARASQNSTQPQVGTGSASRAARWDGRDPRVEICKAPFEGTREARLRRGCSSQSWT
jgi:hypothetical protein